MSKVLNIIKQILNSFMHFIKVLKIYNSLNILYC